jgi:hypothetical protein
MRQSLTLILSFGALVVVSGTADLSAQSSPAPLVAAAPQDAAAPTNIAESIGARRVELAERELRRITDLVAAGALPRIRLDDAQMDLDDARDEAVLDRTLYAGYSEQTATDQATREQSSADMIAAAQRRVDREQSRIEHMREIVSAGVAAQSTMQPLEEELSLRQSSLDLAKLHAHLLEEAAEMKSVSRPQEISEPPAEDFTSGMEHFEGESGFTESRDLAPIELAFESRFAKPLPISANGETNTHRALGFDHRGRVDVAVDPTQPEGIWLREYLKVRGIPYYAFTHAIPGKATAAHIHIGPGSTRLISRVTRRHNTRLLSRVSSRRTTRLVSSRLRARNHNRNAD